MDLNDPKNVEKLKKFAQEELSPEALARRQANTGKASDDDVQNAVDDADGTHDGDIVNEPESDVQAAIHVYRDSKQGQLDKLELFGRASKAVFTRGERHVDPEDWAQLGLILGPALVDAVKLVVALVK